MRDYLLPILRRFFGVGQFLVAAVVAALLDELAGFRQGGFVAEEAGTGEGGCPPAAPHGTTFGDLPCRVQIGPGAVRVTLQKSCSLPHPGGRGA